ncbi:MAG: FHA domain-containing protein, partial [Blastocatellia bacterium]|nr:FHA domain-containing protein [Blastocatellia bacterium]
MAQKNRYIIKRTDMDSGVDDVVIESEGLTIGRLVGNDLVLNHRAVSRTHAGIKEIGGKFLVFNLSTSNGTVLNGQLVDKEILEDGDTLQMGPYLLEINVLQNALSITVERAIQVSPLEVMGGTTTLVDDGSGKTMMIEIPGVARRKGATRQLKGTALLAADAMPSLDQAALDVFWEKRKREAGKIAEKTPLHPRGGQVFG